MRFTERILPGLSFVVFLGTWAGGTLFDWPGGYVIALVAWGTCIVSTSAA